MAEREVDLELGQLYRIWFKTDGQRRLRGMVARYMGYSKTLNVHEFDLRPQAGTVRLPSDVIRYFARVTDETPVSTPTILNMPRGRDRSS